LNFRIRDRTARALPYRNTVAIPSTRSIGL
jgi:hypothetical protein